MDAEDQALLQLKEQMTEQQRQDMADMLRAELKRRQKEKLMGTINSGTPKEKSKVKSSGLSSNLDASHVGEMYSELNDNVRQLRLKHLEKRVKEAKAQQQRLGKGLKSKSRSANKGGLLGAFLPKGPELSLEEGYQPGIEEHTGSMHPPLSSNKAVSPRNLLLMGAVVALAALKVVFSTGVVDASIRNAQPLQAEPVSHRSRIIPAATEMPAEQTPTNHQVPARTLEPASGEWSPADKQLLTRLDARRVELEQRRAVIERREAELRDKEQALAERLAELRTLTAKLEKKRTEKEHHYEARLEQLASVYGSMPPQEAGPLIARLDDSIALALLERMPGKRIGQILALMDQDRAIALTKSLTDKKML